LDQTVSQIAWGCDASGPANAVATPFENAHGKRNNFSVSALFMEVLQVEGVPLRLLEGAASRFGRSCFVLENKDVTVTEQDGIGPAPDDRYRIL
jgi:hypothetical protein